MPKGIRLSILGFVLLAAGTATVRAAEGRIPVFRPGTTIAADGRYIVTRNLTGAGGIPTVTIAASNVDLDLNGFVVSNVSGPEPVILVQAGSRVSIHGGTVTGGTYAIHATSFADGLVIEDLEIHGTAGYGVLVASGKRVTIRRNRFSDISGGGVFCYGNPTPVTATISDNSIADVIGDGIHLEGATGSAIQNNRISNATGMGILLSSAEAGLIADNTVDRAQFLGVAVFQGNGVIVRGNAVTRSYSHGIFVDQLTNDCLISQNNASKNGTSDDGGDGIRIEGDRNLIERNVSNSNRGYGLHFISSFSPACGNTFSANSAHGNSGLGPACASGLFPPESCDSSTGCAVPNKSFGDNLIPGPPLF